MPFKASYEIRIFYSFFHTLLSLTPLAAEPESRELFGEKFPNLDHLSTGEWWKTGKAPGKSHPKKESHLKESSS